MSFAEYRVGVEMEKSREDFNSALVWLLSLTELPWQHQRDTGPRYYDLRALIDDLWIIEWQEGNCVIGMKLHCGSRGSGRPEQVTAALGLENYPESIERTRLILKTN